jgi:hypothetical protein
MIEHETSRNLLREAIPSNAKLTVISALPGRIRYEVRSLLWRQPQRAAAAEMTLVWGYREFVPRPQIPLPEACSSITIHN